MVTTRGLLAFAVLGAVAIPAIASSQEIKNELYGDFRYSFNRVDPADEVRWSAVDNASRLGVRGGVIGGRVEAFYHLETGALVNASDGTAAMTQRFFLAGIRTHLGSVTVGRHSPAYKMSGLALDPFYDSSSLNAGAAVPSGAAAAGASFGLSRLTNGWADRTVQYASPEIGGVSGIAAFHPGPDGDHDVGLGLRYLAEGFQTGVDYRRQRSEGYNWGPALGIEDAFRLHARYAADDRWSLGVSVEQLSAPAGSRQRFLYAAGTLQVAERTTLAVAAGGAGAGDTGHPEGIAGHVGAFVELLPRTRAHVLYSRASLEEAPSRQTLSVGLSVAFSWDQVVPSW